MFGFDMFGAVPRTFNTQFRCYSVVMFPGNEREDVERGGKIIMPPSALDQLTRLHIVYPMLFKLTNSRLGRNTHCGVLEFVADEGKIYLPYWMMRNLLLEEGGLLQVQSASLPVASYAKFQPQSVDFLDITNPKAVLENALRSFACLTKGDIIAIKYNERIYELLVLETKPRDAVSIIECDMQVEFAPPVGYVEPERQERKTEKQQEEHTNLPQELVDHGFQAFTGSGFRLDGKKKKSTVSSDPVPMRPPVIKRGIPNYNFEKGKITFKRNLNKSNSSQFSDKGEVTKPEFEAFTGSGKTLRQKRKN
ncbi:PREDICTED: ubiquitin fusion degradation protein 1 homolog isoform X1 [Acropora digitifera]|uniref:ubiquitin fusion degradation protein 1 homolog isoform X1 n=2 Tax=Acropora digitifera TaxID=70779 RepID=UPI00077A945D|nr:PREDICTED: ubiquitin fusion degradation protein 1 homolog isoform X1 [Acropora digitifera]